MSRPSALSLRTLPPDERFALQHATAALLLHIHFLEKTLSPWITYVPNKNTLRESIAIVEKFQRGELRKALAARAPEMGVERV